MYSNKKVNFDAAEQRNDELRKIETASRQMTDESEVVGAATLRMTHGQGEQLHRTEMALDSMHVGLHGAEANLIQMQRSNSRRKEKHSGIWKTTPAQAPVVKKSKPANSQNAILAQGDFLSRITYDAKEDEMETNLREVSNVLGNLKQIAIDLGSEISRQDPMLDRINLKVESNQHRLQSAQIRTDNLLKS